MEEEVKDEVQSQEPVKEIGVKAVINKNLLIGLIMVVIVAVIIAVVGISNKEKTVDYKEQIKEFGKACASDEKMEEYVNKYVNLRAYYAMQNSSSPDKVDSQYKLATKDQYESASFVNKVLSLFKMYSTLKTELNITDIGEMEDVTSADKDILQEFAEVKNLTKAKFTIENEGQTAELYAIFYKGKMLMVTATTASL